MAKAKKLKSAESTSLSKNKKAFHDFNILDTFEAGLALTGDEVKSIRNGQANLKGAYIEVLSEEAFLREAHISRYKYSSNFDYNPTRHRKLILHKKEISRIAETLSQKGLTVIPLELYLKGSLIKISIGLCQGKKLFDKRTTLRKRDQDMEIKRAIKKYR